MNNLFYIYTRQQKKRIFLLSHSFYFININSILYILHCKQTCLCMAIGFAVCLCHNSISKKKKKKEKNADFCQKDAKITKFLLTVSRTQFLMCLLAAREFNMT